MRKKKQKQPPFTKWIVGILSAAIVVLGTVGYLGEKGGFNTDALQSATQVLNNTSKKAADGGIIRSILNAIDSFLYGGPTKAPPSLPASGEVKVTILDVGQGESILVTTESKSLLIDTGENDKGDEVIDYLTRLGVTSLDYVLATHPHSDHIGGMDFVLENIPVGQVLFGAVPDDVTPTTKTYTDVLGVIKDKNIPLKIVSHGESYALGGGASLTILGPVDEYDDLNDCSVVSRLDFGDTSFLFNGDMESKAEKALIKSGANIKADVMTMGHHGSKTSSSEEYFGRVAPEFASISCGKGNKYGHPNAETLTELKTAATEYYRTDVNGNITFTSTGKKIAVETEKP